MCVCVCVHILQGLRRLFSSPWHIFLLPASKSYNSDLTQSAIFMSSVSCIYSGLTDESLATRIIKHIETYASFQCVACDILLKLPACEKEKQLIRTFLLRLKGHATNFFSRIQVQTAWGGLLNYDVSCSFGAWSLTNVFRILEKRLLCCILGCVGSSSCRQWRLKVEIFQTRCTNFE